MRKKTSINIDVDKKTEENEVRIEEIKELIPNLIRKKRALEAELDKLTNVNLFLSEEKEKLKK